MKEGKRILEGLETPPVIEREFERSIRGYMALRDVVRIAQYMQRVFRNPAL